MTSASSQDQHREIDSNQSITDPITINNKLIHKINLMMGDDRNASNQQEFLFSNDGKILANTNYLDGINIEDDHSSSSSIKSSSTSSLFSNDSDCCTEIYLTEINDCDKDETVALENANNNDHYSDRDSISNKNYFIDEDEFNLENEFNSIINEQYQFDQPNHPNDIESSPLSEYDQSSTFFNSISPLYPIDDRINISNNINHNKETNNLNKDDSNDQSSCVILNTFSKDFDSNRTLLTNGQTHHEEFDSNKSKQGADEIDYDQIEQIICNDDPKNLEITYIKTKDADKIVQNDQTLILKHQEELNNFVANSTNETDHFSSKSTSFDSINDSQTDPPSNIEHSSTLKSSMMNTIDLQNKDQLNGVVDHTVELVNCSNASVSNNTIYDTQNDDNFMKNSNQVGLDEPYVVLTKMENSCSFVERKISLAKQIKIGRSIGRLRPSHENAVFDCKVLSRNHALLWYQDGKFYLKDTCSSNGTFVNNQRLSVANERSQPQVIYSGDCVQFGVEVTEKKNIHSCVIATVRLFHPNGIEAKKDYSYQNIHGLDEQQFLNYPNSLINISPSQLIDLSSKIKATLRKQILMESQLESVKDITKEALTSANQVWQCSVEEDRLLSRIQSLQSQLEICLIAKNQKSSKDDIIIEALKQRNLQLISDKEKFEQESKESLRKVLANKIHLETTLSTNKAQLNAYVEECSLLRETIDTNLKEIKILINNCDKLKKEKEEIIANMDKFSNENEKYKQKISQLSKMIQNKNNSYRDNECQTMTPNMFSTVSNDDDFFQMKSTQTEKLLIDVEKDIQTDSTELVHQEIQVDLFSEQNDQKNLENKTIVENHLISIRKFNNLLQSKLAELIESLEGKNFALNKIYNDHTEKLKSLFNKIKQLQNTKDEKYLQQKSESVKLSYELEQCRQTMQHLTEENEKLKCDIEALRIETKSMMMVKEKFFSINAEKDLTQSEVTETMANHSSISSRQTFIDKSDRIGNHHDHNSSSSPFPPESTSSLLTKLAVKNLDEIDQCHHRSESNPIQLNNVYNSQNDSGLEKDINERLEELISENISIKKINENMITEVNELERKLKLISAQTDVVSTDLFFLTFYN
ncbi:hypothetical protein NH340_JMT08333 [Sarcoptes scabiei]|nr:hypothetical protein NH340_JMT08333 [Sarcoptes scabiei]